MKVRYWAAGVVASLGMASSDWAQMVAPQYAANPYANAPYLQGVAAPRVACNCASPGGYTVAEPTATYAAPVENYAPPAMEMGGAPAMLATEGAPCDGGYPMPVDGGYGGGYPAASCNTGSCADGSCQGGGWMSGRMGNLLNRNCGNVVWGGSVGFVSLVRSEQNPYYFSYGSGQEDNQLLDVRDVGDDWAPGMEVRLTRFDICKQTGWEIGYWQLFNNGGYDDVRDTDVVGNLDSIRNEDQLNFPNPYAPANTYVDDAQIHRVDRDWNIHNFEANRLIVFSNPCACGSPWSFNSICGFRYFRFDESVLFRADNNDYMIDNDPTEYRLHTITKNNLYGFQLGGMSEYFATCRTSLVFGAKAGVFANDIDMSYYEGSYTAPNTINNGPNQGQLTVAHADKQSLATIGELILGVNHRIGCKWRVGADYCVIGVAGVALPSNQIFPDTRGINDVRLMDSNGSLILHGAFIRAERCF